MIKHYNVMSVLNIFCVTYFSAPITMPDLQNIDVSHTVNLSALPLASDRLSKP